MKTAMRFFVAAVGIFLLAPHCLLAKDNINEGKAWLAAKTEPAEINVDGTWDSSEWGMMLLRQAKNAREVTGTADNWEIEGVVSGKKVFLVFSNKGKLVYTAEASQKEDGSLSGSYIKGIMQSDSGNKAMLLRKTAEAQTSQPVDAGNAPTHVVVYRKHYHNCPQVKAPVYVDGKEVADLQNGRYLTLNLSPGKHMIGTTKIGRMAVRPSISIWRREQHITSTLNFLRHGYARSIFRRPTHPKLPKQLPNSSRTTLSA